MPLSARANSAKPYVAGEQPQDRRYIKLNTNENPYPPAPSVRAALDGLDYERLRLYPDPYSTDLRAAVAAAEGVKPQNVFVGNGSDEVLALAFAALLDERLPVLTADVTYSFYPVFCRLFGLQHKTVPLDAQYRWHADDYRGQPCGGIVVANPNAPTSLAVPAKDIERLAHARPDVTVICDEAYIDFADRATSTVPLTASCPNLLTVKTFSKSYGLAGMRCGYAVGSPDLIDGLCRIKDSFNSYPVDTVSQRVCAAAVADRAYLAGRVAAVKATRARLTGALRAQGYEVADSDTNFLFVTVPGGDGQRAYELLRARGVLVRYFSAPRLCDKLRITVGSDAEADELLRATAAVLAE